MYIYCVGCRMFTCIHISPLRDTSNFPVGDINHATDHQQQTTAQQQLELETNLRGMKLVCQHKYHKGKVGWLAKILILKDVCP